MTEDPKISRRYRELSREEPSREIDAAILAAARRAAEIRPAPLVVPSGRLRWYFPLAAAAIIVLAVAVTIHVEREQPDPELAVAPVTVPEAQREEQAAQPRVFAPDPKRQAPAAESAVAPSPELRAQRDAVPAEPQAAPAPASAPASPPAADEMRRREAAAQERAQQERATAQGAARQERAAAGVRESQRADAPSPMAKQAVEPPEKWLERIAELRKQGKHDEADKALAEFKRAYPDYRISEAMLEKVEKK